MLNVIRWSFRGRAFAPAQFAGLLPILPPPLACLLQDRFLACYDIPLERSGFLFIQVDGRLEEDHNRRFIRLLRKFKEQTQSMVVTHKPRTIEAAGGVHGETMEEPGVNIRSAHAGWGPGGGEGGA